MKIFISFHLKDISHAKRLAEMLSRLSIPFYMVSENYNPNGKHHQRIKDEVLQEMKNCTTLICIVGKETHTRPHVDWELHNSLKEINSKRKGIIAVLLEERGDNKNAIDRNRFPNRLLKNEKYVIFEQYASIHDRLEKCIIQAERRRNGSQIQNPEPMPLRNKRMQTNNRIY